MCNEMCEDAHGGVAVLSDNVPLVVSRQVLLAFSQEITRLPAESNKAVAT